MNQKLLHLMHFVSIFLNYFLFVFCLFVNQFDSIFFLVDSNACGLCLLKQCHIRNVIVRSTSVCLIDMKKYAYFNTSDFVNNACFCFSDWQVY